MLIQYKKAIFFILLNYFFALVVGLLGFYLPFWAAERVVDCSDLNRLGFILPVDLLLNNHLLQIAFLSGVLIIVYLLIARLSNVIPALSGIGMIYVSLMWIFSYFSGKDFISGCTVLISTKSMWAAVTIICFSVLFIVLRLRQHVSLPRKKKTGYEKQGKVALISKISDKIQASGLDAIIALVFDLICVILFFYFYFNGRLEAFVLIALVPIIQALRFIFRVKKLDLG